MKRLFDIFALEAEEPIHQQETEVVIFAKITDFEGLNQAEEKEQHIQYTIPPSSKGKIRARATTRGDQTVYTVTVKVKEKSPEDTNGINVDSVFEYNTVVDKDFFDGFGKVAEGIQDKTRFIFTSTGPKLILNTDTNIELPEVRYEIDVFKKPDGTFNEWCKIEVEIDSILTFMNQNHPEVNVEKMTISVSHLPFKPTEAFIGKEANEEQKAIIDSIFI